MPKPVSARPRPTHYLSGDADRVRFARRSFPRRMVRVLLVLSCLGGIAAGAGVCAALLVVNRTPREWAPFVIKRAYGHRHFIEETGSLIAWWLRYTDRMQPAEPFSLPESLGASEQRSGPAPDGRVIPVNTIAAFLGAIANAQPGDVIQLAPGRYPYMGYAIHVNRPGTATQPIIVRAAHLGDATIESNGPVAFNVEAPFWRFENLVMRGTCYNAGDCEHAFHVVAGATDLVIRNNRLGDYNAAIKINGEGNKWPDRGLVEGNSLINTFARETEHPITPIDMVGASHWIIRGNIIADFARSYAGGATYGAFAKGAGEDTVFERNLIIGEWKLRHVASPQVGLSLGGGGSGEVYRRDLGHTKFEQIGGIIRDNLIVSCNDDGIYLNAAARSLVEHNTLLDTAGIDARFVQTSATVTDNLVDGVIRTRDGAILNAWHNAQPFLLGLFVGWHPQRGYFTDPAALDLSWRSQPPEADASDSQELDFCGQPRGPHPRVGAFNDYAACLAPR
ncbi:MAG TPA: right-handed parallel beta-helix repeat-containing protein, partial [Rhodopila sp.]|nr:right-handed parallel beta-helix repeat-containing protein [Rhodopila sp.]